MVKHGYHPSIPNGLLAVALGILKLDIAVQLTEIG
jgi:hypothetical protein